MTAAGIATLFITQDYLRSNDGIQCQGNITNPNIEAGLKWMTDHFDLVIGSSGYTLYGLERIGVASGYKYFGTHDWYQVGSDIVVKRQASNGSWGSVVETCFNLLFLARGRAPVVMNKLEYQIEPTSEKGKTPVTGNWNQRPRDAANVSRWIGKQLERDLNWQIVNLDVSVEELHDAPILYLSGDQTLNFSKEAQDKLRQFVEEGGLILANADGGKSLFTASFRKLGQTLFPGYEFRELEGKHPIYTRQQFPRAKWSSKPNVLALSNGARELMILIPQADAAKYWQMQASGDKEELFQLAADIFQYAVDKQNLRYKGETYTVLPDPKAQTKSTLKVARLQYKGAWDPEPGGWRRLSAIFRNQYGIDLTADPVALGDGKLAGYKIAHLTGVSGFTLTEKARGELKTFLQNGGTLIVDAAGGSSTFAEAAEAEIKAVSGEDLTPSEKILPGKHKIYTLTINPIETVSYRNYTRTTIFSGLSRPRIRGTPAGDRTNIFYSPEDLSVGLVGQPVDGILGYEPKTATAIMTNILLYAAGDTVKPVVPPAKKP